MKTITKVLAGYTVASVVMQIAEYATCKTHCLMKLYDKFGVVDSKTIDEVREIENHQAKLYEDRSVTDAIVSCVVAPVNMVYSTLFAISASGNLDKMINYVKEAQNS